jgi:hypothetical protein
LDSPLPARRQHNFSGTECERIVHDVTHDAFAALANVSAFDADLVARMASGRADQIGARVIHFKTSDVFIQPGFTNRWGQGLNFAGDWAAMEGQMKSIAVTSMSAC